MFSQELVIPGNSLWYGLYRLHATMGVSARGGAGGGTDQQNGFTAMLKTVSKDVYIKVRGKREMEIELEVGGRRGVRKSGEREEEREEGERVGERREREIEREPASQPSRQIDIQTDTHI